MESFEILAEPNRRNILGLLASQDRTVGEIERRLRMPQPSVSKHLKVLRDAGFVEARVDAQHRVYRLRPEPLMEVDKWLEQFPSLVDPSRRRARASPRSHGGERIDVACVACVAGVLCACASHVQNVHQERKEAMTSANYNPGPAMASGKIEKTNDTTWTLVLVRELKHPPKLVWKALTDPAQLREWAPFDSDTNLGVAGATAKLSTLGAPPAYGVSETKVKRADVEKTLEYTWGGGDMRWELEPLGDNGTRLRLWAGINKGFIAMGAAGWHVCFDVLDQLLAGSPIGRIAGPAAMQLKGFNRLHEEYAKQFGVEMPKWNQGS